MKNEVEKKETPQPLRQDLKDRPVFTPDADIYEKGERFFVIAEMPGVNDKSLDVTLEDGVLTLTGIQAEENFEGLHLDYHDSVPGIFRRSLRLLTDIDQDGIKATVHDGVVRVELPKSEKAKPRKIKVNVA